MEKTENRDIAPRVGEVVEIQGCNCCYVSCMTYIHSYDILIKAFQYVDCIQEFIEMINVPDPTSTPHDRVKVIEEAVSKLTYAQSMMNVCI